MVGNRDIRGETRAEYQGRQEGQKAGRYQSKMRETVQSQNTMIKQRKMRTLRHVSRGNTRLCDGCVCVCECGLSSYVDELAIRVLVQDDGKWSSERSQYSSDGDLWRRSEGTTEAGFFTKPPLQAPPNVRRQPTPESSTRARGRFVWMGPVKLSSK